MLDNPLKILPSDNVEAMSRKLREYNQKLDLLCKCPVEAQHPVTSSWVCTGCGHPVTLWED